MLSIHRLTDPNIVGGVVTQSVLQNTVTCEDILVSVDGSCVTAHTPFTPPHAPTCLPKTANGSVDFTIEDIPVNYETNSDTCGHPRAFGSPTFYYS